MDHSRSNENTALGTVSGDRMVTLDGMRGVAALAVAIYHFDYLFMPGGYMAVDFFFLLSGFVLTRSYGDRLRQAGSLLDFARIRAIRLLPIHMIGILFGASYAMIGVLRHWADALSAPAFAGSVLLNLLMLPAPVNDTFFPSNPPAWSLMYEMLASLALPAFLIRRSNATLLAGCAVALLSMAVISCQLIGPAGVPGALTEPLTYGWGYPYWYIGALRTAFAFPLGILIAG